jgi:hypothetical protein
MSVSTPAERLAKAIDKNAKKTGGRWLVRCLLHDDAKPSLIVSADRNGKLRLYCNAGCASRDLWEEVRRRKLDTGEGDPPSKDDRRRYDLERQREGERNKARALAIFNEVRGLHGSLAARYLDEHRGIDPARVPALDIGFHPRCPREKTTQPALVWRLRDIANNEPVAIQRRFLKPDGSKDGPAVSLGPTTGAVVKLTPDEDVTMGLFICEGVEDGLALLQDGVAPVWACCGWGPIASFPVLDGVEALRIFADSDKVGRAAADMCFIRWRRAGRDVRIITLKTAKDAADHLLARRRIA